MFTEEDKIKAYLSKKMTDADSQAFEEEIKNNPKLAAKVKGFELIVDHNKHLILNHFKEDIKNWSIPNPPIVRGRGGEYIIPLSLATTGFTLILFFIFFYLKKEPIVPQSPQLESPFKFEKLDNANPSIQLDSTSSSDTIIYASNERKKQTSHSFEGTTSKPKFNWLLGIINVVNIKEGTNRIASRSSLQKSPNEEVSLINQANPISTGFITEYNGNDYYICAASNLGVIHNADDLLGKITINGEVISVPFQHLDAFWDIAVAKIPNSIKGKATLIRLPLSENMATVVGEDIFLPTTSSTDKSTNSINWQTAILSGLDYGTLKFESDFNLVNGPIVEKNGQVLGLVTAYNAFNNNEASLKDAISSTQILSILNQLENSQKSKAYLGIGFLEDTINQSITIGYIIPNAPARRYANELLGQRILSINEIKVGSLKEIIAILDRVQPDEAVIIETEKGVFSLFTNAMGQTELGQIASVAIENIENNFFLSNTRTPKIEHESSNGFASGIYRVIALCSQNENCWENTTTLSELGERIRLANYKGEGQLFVTKEDKPDNYQKINLIFKNNILWY